MHVADYFDGDLDHHLTRQLAGKTTTLLAGHRAAVIEDGRVTGYRDIPAGTEVTLTRFTNAGFRGIVAAGRTPGGAYVADIPTAGLADVIAVRRRPGGPACRI